MVDFATDIEPLDFVKEKAVRIAKVAKHYEVNRRTIEAWIHQGMRAKKLGRLVYTTWEEVDRFAKPVVIAGGDGASTETENQKEAREAIERIRQSGFKV